jgi:hypothetical protein
MSRQRMGVGAIVFLAVMLFPRVSSADFIDFIWQMSGPRMFTVGAFEWRFPLPQSQPALPQPPAPGAPQPIPLTEKQSVGFYDIPKLTPVKPTGEFHISDAVSTPLPPGVDPRGRRPQAANGEPVPTSWGWFALGVTMYASTGRDSDDARYSPFENFMVAVDPMLQGLLYSSKPVTLYVGAGPSYQLLFGKHFSAFDKFALKIRPIGFILGDRLDVAPTIRVYPHGYSSDEFGNGPRMHYNRPSEIVYGIDTGISFSRRDRLRKD